MKQLNYLLLACGLLMFMTACLDTDSPRPNIGEQDESPKIDLLNPEIGQFNTYREITYRCGEVIESSNRNLHLEIIRVDEHSITFLESTNNTPTQEYTAERLNGRISISAEQRATSALLYFYGDDVIRLADNPTAAVEQKDCVFYDENDVKFTGEYVASVDHFELDGFTLSDIKAVSCVPLVLDVDGYLLFNENNILASITAENFGESPFVRAFVLD